MSLSFSIFEKSDCGCGCSARCAGGGELGQLDVFGRTPESYIVGHPDWVLWMNRSFNSGFDAQYGGGGGSFSFGGGYRPPDDSQPFDGSASPFPAGANSGSTVPANAGSGDAVPAAASSVSGPPVLLIAAVAAVGLLLVLK